ncbi:MAG: hypothetical protein FWH43_04840 [Endomicrobia bacterium]|nr:hypothetical protein [Endomicrobiia bacterium]
MKRFAFLALLPVFAVCQAVPVTGRSRLLLFFDSKITEELKKIISKVMPYHKKS